MEVGGGGRERMEDGGRRWEEGKELRWEEVEGSPNLLCSALPPSPNLPHHRSLTTARHPPPCPRDSCIS
eukprot:6252566-Pyramimonas_sp.AAC.1